MAEPGETAPPAGLVSLGQAKQHLRVFHADEDTLINLYIAAASADVVKRWTPVSPTPPDIVAAVLLKVEHLYDPGDDTRSAARLKTIDSLLWSHQTPEV